jgi:hypothetical protein
VKIVLKYLALHEDLSLFYFPVQVLAGKKQSSAHNTSSVVLILRDALGRSGSSRDSWAVREIRTPFGSEELVPSSDEVRHFCGPAGLCKTSSSYSRTALIRINWDDEPFGCAESPDNWIFFLICDVGSLRFGCYYLQYILASEPFDHAWFEVLEAITM